MLLRLLLKALAQRSPLSSFYLTPRGADHFGGSPHVFVCIKDHTAHHCAETLLGKAFHLSDQMVTT
jgi:hypothetical protein